MLAKWRNMGLRDWDNSFNAMDELRREMNRIFGEMDRSGRGLSSSGQYGPAMELNDIGKALKVRANIPGMQEKDIHVSLEANSLTIKGERSDDTPEGYSVHRKERSAFTFSRAFTLPCKVDVGKTTAVIANGVLTLTMPKVPEAQPRQIKIQTK